MLESAQNEYRYREQDSNDVFIAAVHAYGDIHQYSAEQAADQRLRERLSVKLRLAERYCRFFQFGYCEAEREPAGADTDRVSEQPQQQYRQFFFAV